MASRRVSDSVEIPTTLTELLEYHRSHYTHPAGLSLRKNGRWEGISSENLGTIVRHTALGLHQIGVRMGDRVGLLAENTPNWVVADFAITSIGAVTVPIYTTQVAAQVVYILSNAGAAAQRYGTAVSDQQEVLARISDIMMEVYAIESVLLRVEKNEGRGSASELHRGVVQAFVNDAIVRIEMHARDILSAIFEGDMLRTYLTVLRRLMKNVPLNTVALRRSIADSLIEEGG